MIQVGRKPIRPLRTKLIRAVTIFLSISLKLSKVLHDMATAIPIATVATTMFAGSPI